MRTGRTHAPTPRWGRSTPAAPSTSSMTTCSTAPASLPQGAGQCGATRPESTSSRRRSSAAAAASSATSGASSARHRSASSGRSAESSRRAPPAAAAASCSRWTSLPPSSCRSARARFRCRCRSCSQVNPIPPSSCRQSCAQVTYPSRARAAAVVTASTTPSSSSTPAVVPTVAAVPQDGVDGHHGVPGHRGHLVHPHGHVGGPVLDRLELADRPAELDPDLGVLGGRLEAPPGPAGVLGGHQRDHDVADPAGGQPRQLPPRRDHDGVHLDLADPPGGVDAGQGHDPDRPVDRPRRPGTRRSHRRRRPPAPGRPPRSRGRAPGAASRHGDRAVGPPVHHLQRPVAQVRRRPASSRRPGPGSTRRRVVRRQIAGAQGRDGSRGQQRTRRSSPSRSPPGSPPAPAARIPGRRAPRAGGSPASPRRPWRPTPAGAPRPRRRAAPGPPPDRCGRRGTRPPSAEAPRARRSVGSAPVPTSPRRRRAVRVDLAHHLERDGPRRAPVRRHPQRLTVSAAGSAGTDSPSSSSSKLAGAQNTQLPDPMQRSRSTTTRTVVTTDPVWSGRCCRRTGRRASPATLPPPAGPGRVPG